MHKEDNNTPGDRQTGRTNFIASTTGTGRENIGGPSLIIRVQGSLESGGGS